MADQEHIEIQDHLKYTDLSHTDELIDDSVKFLVETPVADSQKSYTTYSFKAVCPTRTIVFTKRFSDILAFQKKAASVENLEFVVLEKGGKSTAEEVVEQRILVLQQAIQQLFDCFPIRRSEVFKKFIEE